MIRLPALALLAHGLFAQAGLYIDLAGDWRYSPHDAPEMARPDYDDAKWNTARLPPESSSFLPAKTGDSVPPGWVRKSVALPDGADRSQLALTLGPFRAVYAVYVNGIRIAQVGSFENKATAQIARTRTFPIPLEAAGSGNPMVLAIRFGGPQGGGVSWELSQQAPYLLTYSAQAPVTAGIDGLLVQRLRYSPNLVLGIVYLVLGIPLLWAWLRERRRAELLWFVLFLLTSCFNMVHNVLTIAPETTPFNRHGVPSVGVVSLITTWALFAIFAITVAGFKTGWLAAIVGSGWLYASVILAGRGGYSVLLGIGILCGAVSLVAIAAGLWKSIQRAARLEDYLLLGLLAVPSASRLSLNLGGNPESYLHFGDYYLGTMHVFTLILAVLIFALLLRRVAIDLRDRQRLKSEMEAGRNIQLLLLGSGAAVQTPAFHVDLVYEPWQEVGGDFHWTRVEPDGSLLAAVGDVSGKGLKAAMLVSVAIGILRNEKSRSPATILEALNRGLTGHTGGGFVTCCCARFDPDGAVTLANAGNPAPYVAGREVEMEASLPLGIAADMVYPETIVHGCSFTFVSDGVVEAARANGELFGFERTREISGKSARDIAETAKAWGQNDDITVVTVRRVTVRRVTVQRVAA